MSEPIDAASAGSPAPGSGYGIRQGQDGQRQRRQSGVEERDQSGRPVLRAIRGGHASIAPLLILSAAGRRRPGRALWAALGAALLLAASVLIYAAREKREAGPRDGLKAAYTYRAAQGTNGVELHMLSASPEHIVLRADTLPLQAIPAYGINGGFFYGKDLLSIAVMNDQPAAGQPKGYGSGWFNAKYPRGTLVWDGAAAAFSVQVVSSADELSVTDRGRYFVQGGVSMSLGSEELWRSRAVSQHLPFMDDRRMRSGLVYDQENKLWLIVSPTLCTAEDFREAVLEQVPGEGREGIFLDGDGSSQMNAREITLIGDGRPVVQMISISAEQ